MNVVNTFSVEQINHQLQRILDSSVFRNSPTLTRFLAFIIHETVQEKQQHIKEYSIAVNVLNRPHNFNPQDDAIVRIHAGRLRRALNEYYFIQGINDPIIIRIPKGCYVPEFSANVTVKRSGEILPALPIQESKPVVAIFPFSVNSPKAGMDELLVLLEEPLNEELLRTHDLSVIGYYSNEMKLKIKENVLEAGRSAGVDYIITASLSKFGESVHVFINLLVTATGEVLLCKSFDSRMLYEGGSEIHDDLVQNVIGFARDCYFVIKQEYRKRRT